MGGFLWIAFDVSVQFPAFSYVRWMGLSKQLPADEVVPRVQAVNSLREFQIVLKDRHREVLLPAILMLAGGILVSRPRKG